MKAKKILATVIASTLSIGVVSTLPTVAEEATPVVADMNVYGARATDESYLLFSYETGDDGRYAVMRGLSTLGKDAYNRNALTNIVIPLEIDDPDGEGKIPVTEIEGYSFYRYEKLTTVIVPSSITSSEIMTMPFYGCTNLTVILCEGTIEIYEYFFAEADITAVVIPSSVTLIGNFAFEHWDDRENPLVVYYAGTEEEWSELLENSKKYYKDQDQYAIAYTGLDNYELVCNVQTSWFDPDLGDINDDGSVTPVDAHQALVAYASEQVGQDTGLTDEEMGYADIDGDGSVTPSDAHYMLLYYATQQVQEGVTWLDILL